MYSNIQLVEINEDMPKIYFLILLFLHTATFSQTETIRAIVKDAKSQEPLEYTLVQLKGKTKATLTDEFGAFSIKAETTDTLIIQLIGYKKRSLAIKNIAQRSTLYLEIETVELEEIIVRPKKPTYYIRKAVRHYYQSIDKEGFSSKSYIQRGLSLLQEKEKVAALDEMLFYTNHEQENISNRLLLHRRNVDGTKQDIPAFLLKKVEKFADSLKQSDLDSLENIDLNKIGISTPEELIGIFTKIMKRKFVDTTKLHKMKYSYMEDENSANDSLINILFESRSRQKMSYYKGIITISKNNYAIKQIKYSNTIQIPIYLRPVFGVVAGFNTKEIHFTYNMKTTLINKKIYPSTLDFYGSMKMIKRHTFRKNENASFQFYMTALLSEHSALKALKKEEIYDHTLRSNQQLYNHENLKWSDILFK